MTNEQMRDLMNYIDEIPEQIRAMMSGDTEWLKASYNRKAKIEAKYKDEDA